MSKWIPAWRSVPIDYNYEVATFENITQNCLMINNLRGEQMRIRFNNLYSNSPIAIDYVTVSLSNRVTGRRSTRQTVTLDGEETIWLCANSQPYSDPVPMEITPEDDILVSMYFRRKTAFRSVCVTSAAGRVRTSQGIFTKRTHWATRSNPSLHPRWLPTPTLTSLPRASARWPC